MAERSALVTSALFPFGIDANSNNGTNTFASPNPR